LFQVFRDCGGARRQKLLLGTGANDDDFGAVVQSSLKRLFVQILRLFFRLPADKGYGFDAALRPAGNYGGKGVGDAVDFDAVFAGGGDAAQAFFDVHKRAFRGN